MINSWSWTSFFQTLLATAVGAAIGVFGIFWQVRNEKNERYEIRLTEKLSDLNNSMIRIAEKPIYTKESMIDDLQTITLTLNNISMLANSKDQKIIHKLIACCDTRFSMDVLKFNHHLGWVIGTISGWRNEYGPRKLFLNEIEEKLKEIKAENHPILSKYH